MDAGLLRGNLELILLAVIADGEFYGLDIANRARIRSSGYFNFSVGSLYPALHRLEREGLLTSRAGLSPHGGGQVKFYRLTAHGRRSLVLRRREFRQFTKAVLTLATDAAA